MEKDVTDLFSKKVGDYIAWKKHVLKQLNVYRTWLDANQLSTEEVDQKLLIAKGALQRDQITLAFVGEFSRGKTELINALFFAQHGQRLLPSRPGRTTMCPTELYFDLNSRESWIQLLPIESKQDGKQIRELKETPDAWTHFDLDLGSAEQMAETLRHVCDAKSVTPEAAAELGFEVNLLESDPAQPKQVLIPAWRHALVSFDHPLLRQGLRIIDTPGLNALGSEPELTLKLLEESQAVLFLLSADAGVTASDMSLWNDHIKSLSGRLNEKMFVVLNKIDTLWDDPDGEDVTQEHLQHVIHQVSQALKISSDGVVPLSAKAGLRGKLFAMDELLEASGLNQFEQTLSESIIRGKEDTLKSQVVTDALSIMSANRKLLLDEKQDISSDLKSLKNAQGQGETRLSRLNQRVKKEQNYYKKRLLVLKPIEKRLKTQLPNWIRPFNEESIDKWHKALKPNEKKLSKRELKICLCNYFNLVKSDFATLIENSNQASSLIQHLYKEYAKDHAKFSLNYDAFDSNHFKTQIEALEGKSLAYTKASLQFWKDQFFAPNHFSNALHLQIAELARNERKAIENWCNQAMTPILYHAQQRLKVWDTQANRLNKLLHSPSDIPDHLNRLEQDLASITEKLTGLTSIIDQIQLFNPQAQVPVLKQSTN